MSDTPLPNAVTVPLDPEGNVGTLPEPLQKFLDAKIADALKRGQQKALASVKLPDPVEQEQARQEREELAALRMEKAEREKRYEDALKLRDEAHTKSLEQERAERARYEQRLRDSLGAEVRAAAAQAGAREESLPELVKLIGADLGLDDDLNPVILNDDGQVLMDEATNAPVSVQDYVAAYLDQHPHHRVAPQPGGGARGGLLLRTGAGYNDAETRAAAALDEWQRTQSTEAMLAYRQAQREVASRKSR